MQKQTILLIQSTLTRGNDTQRLLEGNGYKVFVSGSVLTALTITRQEVIDLILLDVALPDIEGLDLCHRFRKRPDTRSIPIILITARGYTPEHMADKAYGPDDYLAKPYTGSELRNRIACVLNGKTVAVEQDVKQRLRPMPTVDATQQGSNGATIQFPEPRPALITVMQQTPKPNLKLVPNAPPAHRSQPASAAARKRELTPEQNVKPGPFLHAVPPADLMLISKQGPEDIRKPEPAPSHGRGSNPEKQSELHQDNRSPPILSFAGTGDTVDDPATGLFGRPQFEAMFSKEFKRAVRFQQQMSCMLINLDGQKMMRRADEGLVKAIIGLVQKTIREVDTAAWWSGEAFIVLLPNTIRNDALQAAARILEAVANHPFTWPDATNVTMSIGVVGLPDHKIDSEQKMIDAADAVCRRAQELMVPPPIDMSSMKR
ncbi:MAG TPA: diguanylate cyclase [Nitrospirota bacterium]|nr:diguanylate cyclase [Nitrospirota bacterium]